MENTEDNTKQNLAKDSAAHINEVFLKNITKILPQYVFWKDTNSVYLGCNLNFAKLVGLNTVDDIIGKTDEDLNWLTTGDTAKKFKEGDQATIAGSCINNQEEVLALPNGITMSTLVSKLPIIDDGQILGIVGYFTDISYIKQKERELTEAKKNADEANLAKSQFITNISHDIRTPLAGMIGMTNIITKSLITRESKQAAEKLLTSCHALLDLLNEVIEIKCIELGNFPVHYDIFNLKELIDSLEELITPSIISKKLQFTIDYDANIPKLVIGDRKRIHRILLNLVGNSIKFTTNGGIKISCKTVHKQQDDIIIQFKIRDTGIGIPESDLETVFSKFTKLNASYTGKFKGYGLGLSIVREFVTDLDGSIELESSPGQGTTFSIEIPLQIAKATSDITNKKATEAPIDSKEIEGLDVLVVEDNEIAQVAIANQLSTLNCHADIAGDAASALKLLEKNRYNIILMDIGLPDQDGCSLTQAIRAQETPQQHTPIVALTAHAGDEQSHNCIECGMQHVLTKPVNNTQLLTIFKKYALPQKTNNTENQPSIDLNLSRELASSDDEAKEILQLFIESLPEHLSNLTNYYEIDDKNKLASEVHKLHSSVCYCGVPRLKQLTEKLEDSLKLNKNVAIGDLYKSLIDEINNVLSDYKKLQ